MKIHIRPYRNNPEKKEADIHLPGWRRTYVVPVSVYRHLQSPSAQDKAIHQWAEKRALGAYREPAKPKTEAPQLSPVIGSDGKPEPISFEDFFPIFIGNLPECSPNTVMGYERNWRLHLKPLVGKLLLTEVAEEAITKITTQLKTKTCSRPGSNTSKDRKHAKKRQEGHTNDDKTLESKSINTILACLGSILERAHRWGRIPRQPVITYLPVARAESARISKDKYYSEPEAEAVIKAARFFGPHPLAFVLLGLDAGLRVGEIAALTWEQVDLDNQVISVDRAMVSLKGKNIIKLPKADKKGTVVISDRLTQALRALGTHRPTGRILERQVFSQEATRGLHRDDQGKVKSLSITNLKYWTKQITKKAQEYCPTVKVSSKTHKMRHTLGTKLAQDVRFVKQQLRHANINTSMIYVHSEHSQEIKDILNSQTPVKPILSIIKEKQS